MRGTSLELAVLGAQQRQLSYRGGGSHTLSAPEKHVAVVSCTSHAPEKPGYLSVRMAARASASTCPLALSDSAHAFNGLCLCF